MPPATVTKNGLVMSRNTSAMLLKVGTPSTRERHATHVPCPFHVCTSPSRASSDNARRTVMRLTSNSSHKSRWESIRAHGLRTPSSIRLRSSFATDSHREEDVSSSVIALIDRAVVGIPAIPNIIPTFEHCNLLTLIKCCRVLLTPLYCG